MLIIDRFEGEYAVCQDADTEKYTDVLIEFLPDDVKEGDCLNLVDGEYTVDIEETERLRQENLDLLSQLFDNK